jgi:hypothetical protein
MGNNLIRMAVFWGNDNEVCERKLSLFLLCTCIIGI